MAAEPLRPLEHHDFERLLRAEVLLDQLFDAGNELIVVENRALHVEDRRFLRAGGRFDALANLAKAFLRAIENVVEPLDFDRVYGAFWKRVIASNAKDAVRQSVARYIEALA